MRKVLAGLCLSLILVNGSFASDAERDLFASDAEYLCTQLMITSQEIMSARLRGFSIVDSMRIAGKGDNPVSRVTKLIVRDAYSEYAYTDPADKKTAIREFGIKNYLICMENYDK